MNHSEGLAWVREENEDVLGGGGGATEWVDTNWIARTKTKSESVSFIEVEGVGVEDAEVHLPFFVVFGGDEADAWREGLVDLRGILDKGGQGEWMEWSSYLGELLVVGNDGSVPMTR